MRSEEVIREQKESAEETAEELDEESPLDALAAQVVYKTLNWVEGNGEEELEEELLKLGEENEE